MLKALMIRKRISDKNKELDALRTKQSELNAKKAEFETREAELASDIEAASTDEERSVVEEAVNAFEAEKRECDSESEEVAGQIKDLEGEVNELERELEETEASQTPVGTPTPEESTSTEITEERNMKTMFKTRSIRNMNLEQRTAFIAREDVKDTLAQVRMLIKEKRTITGADLLIGTTILGLIREDVMNYSKLYSRVNVQTTNGEGRVIIQGVAPEAIWIECCDAIPEVSISFGEVELDCYKVGAYFSVCNAKLDDSDIDLADALIDALNQALGLAIDKAILYGTGVKMPTGVVTAIAADSALAQTNLITIANTYTGKALFQQIVLASGAAKSRYSRGAKTWIMNETTYTKLMAEALEFNAAGAIVSGVDATMPVVGGDIVVLNFVPDNNIILGYFDLYVVLERLGIRIDRSEHAQFIADRTVLRAKARMDGKPAIKNAFAAVGIDGTTPSTTVTFAAIASTQGATQEANGEG